MKDFESLYPVLTSRDKNDARELYDFFTNFTLEKYYFNIIQDLFKNQLISKIDQSPVFLMRYQVFDDIDGNELDNTADISIFKSGEIKIMTQVRPSFNRMYYNTLKISLPVLAWANVINENAQFQFSYYKNWYNKNDIPYINYMGIYVEIINNQKKFSNWGKEKMQETLEIFPVLKKCTTRLGELLKVNEMYGGQFSVELNSLKLAMRNEEVRQIQRNNDLVVTAKKEMSIYLEKEKDKFQEQVADNQRNLDLLKMQALTILNR